ncbi:MAG: class I SAM-dependent methyltransferase [Alkalibacterium sp.]|nr:class I SAM-dependent methyltransferase [Alkalibacterium sp.]
MKDRKEKLAASLTAESTALIPYLPYLLQDLWELGSSPRDICALLEADTPISEDYHVLDLGCGKGAVSIVMAERFKCHVKGIDLLPEFIEEAEQRAIDYGVADICHFKVGDITESVNEEKNYDSVIYGAVGDVLGEPVDMINQLKQTVRAGGYIIIDDGYALDDNAYYYTKKEWLSFLRMQK